jgi:hypothetical protein
MQAEEQAEDGQATKDGLAHAIARGEAIIAWARENGVRERTAYRWAADPEVRREAEAERRRALDRAIGRLAGLAMEAADGIAKLAQDAQSESVQLRAWRAILTDQMAVARFSDLEQRMVEIEEQLRDRTGDAHRAG